MLHLAWVSLQRTHECEILETTLNVKKAMWRQYKLPAQPSAGSFEISSTVQFIKEILWFFTPLNYIQTLKIQIFSRNVGHAFLLHLHISKKPLNWECDTADLAISKIKNATTLKKKKSNHRKAKKKVVVVLSVLQKDMEKFLLKFFIKIATTCQIYV